MDAGVASVGLCPAAASPGSTATAASSPSGAGAALLRSVPPAFSAAATRSLRSRRRSRAPAAARLAEQRGRGRRRDRRSPGRRGCRRASRPGSSGSNGGKASKKLGEACSRSGSSSLRTRAPARRPTALSDAAAPSWPPARAAGSSVEITPRPVGDQLRSRRRPTARRRRSDRPAGGRAPPRPGRSSGERVGAVGSRRGVDHGAHAVLEPITRKPLDLRASRARAPVGAQLDVVVVRRCSRAIRRPSLRRPTPRRRRRRPRADRPGRRPRRRREGRRSRPRRRTRAARPGRSRRRAAAAPGDPGRRGRRAWSPKSGTRAGQAGGGLVLVGVRVEVGVQVGERVRRDQRVGVVGRRAAVAARERARQVRDREGEASR